MKLKIFITHLSGERLFPKPGEFPAEGKITVNANILGLEEKSRNRVEIPFVYVVNYTPSIAQITVKGVVTVEGDEKEIQKLIEEKNRRKTPDRRIIAAVINAATAEAVLISRSIGVPPPLPQIGLPPHKEIKPQSREGWATYMV